MLNEATLNFVSQHSHDDVRMLALHGCKDPDVDLTLALQQIQGRQTARHKLPTWAATDGIVYPPHLNMEQCSSELTARYKAEAANRESVNREIVNRKIVNRKIVNRKSVNRKLIDLTGGFGVDFAFMSEAFSEAVYVERDVQLCAIAAHNFRALGLENVTTVCADAEAVLRDPGGFSGHIVGAAGTAEYSVFIYLDPARRDGHGQRTYALADCTPNVITLMPALLASADCVMLKLSPMLDWRKAVADLEPHHVSEVHIVAVDNECKELLLLLSHDNTPLRLICTNLDGKALQTLSRPLPVGEGSRYSPNWNSQQAMCPLPSLQEWGGGGADGPVGAGSLFLYEPNAAVMKAGCFRELAADFAVTPLADNSHLFCSDRLIDSFPGRRFRIGATCSMNKRELRTTLGHLRQANITVRNFPLTAQQLRHRLKLADGGDDYIFATTLRNKEHLLLLCNKC